MKHIIVGTAGHIDHGKTSLIKALTGRNTDRWKEEQDRGITIDLGFTWFDMKNGDRVGIIDVPGHEKFVGNMVAGVVGMDLVMLVIAADDGIMPQTKEHMDILGLLGIEKSIVVLNKCDLVEEDWLELVEDDVKEALKGTFLENSPIVRTSAETGQGLDELQDEIIRLTSDEMEGRDITTIPRLPIDRVFSISGFGTIITGTLISGTISKDDTLMMYPIEKECKIRNIQVHGKDADSCEAGQRVAINIPNIKKNEIKRGAVIAPINNMKSSDLMDVKLSILPESNRILKNRERLHLFTGTNEVLCRAVIIDKNEIGPGEEGLCQIILEEKIAAKRGDKFVVRFYSPLETIGGGVILEPNPKKKKRFDQKAIDELQKKESGTLGDVMEAHIKESGSNLMTMLELAKTLAHSVEELEEYLSELEAQNCVRVFRMKKDTYLWHIDSEDVTVSKIVGELNDYHRENPYKFGIAKAQILSKYFKGIKPNVFDAIVERLVEEGKLGRYEEFLCAPDFNINKDETYTKVETCLLSEMDRVGFDFTKIEELDLNNLDEKIVNDVIAMLVYEEVLVKLAEDLYTKKSFVDEAKEKIKAVLQENNLITIAQVRDMLENSRKNAKILIEYMDSIKVTKKIGGEAERVAY